MYSLEKRIFLNDNFQKFKSISKVQKAYRSTYKSKSAPSYSVIMNIVNNYKKTGSVARKRIASRRRTVRTDELIESIRLLYVTKPKTSLRRATESIPASVSTIRYVARKDLGLKPFKIPRSFKLYSTDYAKRVNFAKFVKSKRINLTRMLICSDEAIFFLHGGHNIQNDRIWAQFQPNEIAEKPLNDDKVMVWCAFSGFRVYGPYFFEENVNSINYLDMLKNYFWPKHSPYQKQQRFYFQQDEAPPHRAKVVQDWLKKKIWQQVFGQNKLATSFTRSEPV